MNFNVFLVRHCESEANAQNNIIDTIDCKIALTDTGKIQAENTAIKLNQFFNSKQLNRELTRIYVSPFKRTMETSEPIISKIKTSLDAVTDFRLVEQDFGLFDGKDELNWEEIASEEFNRYNKLVNNKGKFYARFPNGESQFDVSIRVKQFFDTMFRDVEKYNLENIIIISHGVTLRVFTMLWMKYQESFIANEKNPANGSIRYLERKDEKNFDNSYIL